MENLLHSFEEALKSRNRYVEKRGMLKLSQENLKNINNIMKD